MGRKAHCVKLATSEHRALASLAKLVGQDQGEVIANLITLAERMVFVASQQFGIDRFRDNNRGRLLELILSKDPGDIHETGELGQTIQALKKEI